MRQPTAPAVGTSVHFPNPGRGSTGTPQAPDHAIFGVEMRSVSPRPGLGKSFSPRSHGWRRGLTYLAATATGVRIRWLACALALRACNARVRSH